MIRRGGIGRDGQPGEPAVSRKAANLIRLEAGEPERAIRASRNADRSHRGGSIFSDFPFQANSPNLVGAKQRKPEGIVWPHSQADRAAIRSWNGICCDLAVYSD